MHYTFIATGIKQDLELWEKFMQTFWFKLPYKDKDGKDQKILFQSQLRPIQLYDFVFPRDKLDVVLNSFNVWQDYVLAKAKEPKPAFQKSLWFLRKALKLKEIPPHDKTKGALALPPLNLRYIGIGIREDEDRTFPDGNTHEAL